MNAHNTPPPSGSSDPLSSADYANYFDSSGHLKADYVDRWADQLAQLFGRDAPRLNKHQMRAFFGEVKRLQALRRAHQDFEVIRNKLLAMKAQAHLRAERRNIPKSFQTFIAKNVDKAAASREAFDAFVQHFEAVAAYCEGRLGKD